MATSKLQRIKNLISRIQARLLGFDFSFIVQCDQIHNSGRYYIQCRYFAPCTHTGESQVWKGRKWYLSEFMTDDEIVKTAWCAFEAAVKHEVMEGFKVDGKILFNPHVSFEALLAISHLEVKREEVTHG